ncbi:Dyp-type peroxidase [Alkalimarinus sediminis]|uniref:Dyp-type peroxidase n=1 Tax=Alkalimarinus sediminis TaxID=1632866 RepID=A0A9E8HLF2_9ALTE|nr:Dyp-type peroxidase [Alkalimarinus sediminis]UZW76629.1 Dyp-type peroxidase [Alkalimarinus sediminis]
MNNSQPGILKPIPVSARYLLFSIEDQSSIREALGRLATLADGHNVVVGLGHSLLSHLETKIDGMRAFPSFVSCGIEIPATHGAIWCWLRGDDRGDLIHKEREITQALSPAFVIDNIVDAFKYKEGLDLSGYEDGTENPEGDDAVACALVSSNQKGMDGSSFVAVQQWVHDLNKFDDMEPIEQDHTIGRRKSDNEELDDAPASAHVKRTAQEDFDPEAFVIRRSMPWANEAGEGLNFVAFGESFDAFEAQLNRMTGRDDQIVDALFRFTRPITGGYFWCPPVVDGKLDLSVLKLA